MPPDRIATALRDLAATLPEGARLPSVRELMREHGASPVTVQRAIATLSAEGLVVPRPGRGTFVAAPPARNGTPDLAWQEVALGAARMEDDGGLAELLTTPPGGTLALSSGYLDPRLQPTAAMAAALARAGRRPGAWERGAGRGRRGAAGVVRARGGRALRRPRRRRLPRRPGRARHRRAGARAARRLGGRRVAHLPRRARRRPGGRAHAGARAQRRRRRAARRCSPTRSSAPAPASPTCSRCTPTRTAPTCRRSGAPR